MDCKKQNHRKSDQNIRKISSRSSAAIFVNEGHDCQQGLQFHPSSCIHGYVSSLCLIAEYDRLEWAVAGRSGLKTAWARGTLWCEGLCCWQALACHL